MLKTNKSENLYLHTSRKKKLFRSWFRYRKFATHLEISTSRHGPSFKLHLGNASSETPIDWHICLFWISFYGSFDWPGLGKVCEWVGRGHKRDLSLSVFGGQLWWKLWYDDDGGYDNYHNCNPRRKTWWWPFSWYREKYRSWMCLRNGNIELNPLSAIWGIRYYHYETTMTKEVTLLIDEFPEDSYQVILKLQETYRNRNSGPSWARWISFEGLNVDWRCDAGIPFHNHDWKGDNVYGSGIKLPEGDVDDWVLTSKELLIKQIRKDRERHNYQPRVGDNNG